MIRLVGFLIRARWNLLRLLVAAFIVWVLAADSGARIARIALSRMPGFDYAAEIDALRLQGRYGEAELLANAGFEDAEANHESIRIELAQVIEERDSVIRRALDVGKGAVTGRGDSMESLIGAVGSDFFIIGDLRDLIIEGGRFVIDGESDELIVLLSATGVVTTVAPEIDWVPSILKAARKAGFLGQRFSSNLASMIRAKRTEDLRATLIDFRKLSDASSPGSAMRFLRYAESPEDLSVITRFVGRGRSAAAALHVTGSSGATFLKSVDPNDADAFARAAAVVERAGMKGSSGSAFLNSSAAKRLLRPHPLIGLSKGLIKSNVSRLIERLAERIDPWGGTLLAFSAVWLLVECVLIRSAFNCHWRSEQCQTS